MLPSSCSVHGDDEPVILTMLWTLMLLAPSFMTSSVARAGATDPATTATCRS